VDPVRGRPIVDCKARGVKREANRFPKESFRPTAVDAPCSGASAPGLLELLSMRRIRTSAESWSFHAFTPSG
jgi:hypothetical protein